MSLGSRAHEGEVTVADLVRTVQMRRSIPGMAGYSAHPQEVAARVRVLGQTRMAYLASPGAFTALITPALLASSFKETRKLWDKAGILGHVQVGAIALYGFSPEDKAQWGAATKAVRMLQERAGGYYLPGIGWYPYRPMDYSQAFEQKKLDKLQGVMQHITRLEEGVQQIDRKLEALDWSTQTVQALFDRAHATFVEARAQIGVFTVKGGGFEQFDSLEDRASLVLGALDLQSEGVKLPLGLKAHRLDLLLGSHFTSTPYAGAVRALKATYKLRKLALARKSPTRRASLHKSRETLLAQLDRARASIRFSGGAAGLTWLTKSVQCRTALATEVFEGKFGVESLEVTVARCRTEAMLPDAPRRVGLDAWERQLIGLAYQDKEDNLLEQEEIEHIMNQYDTFLKPYQERSGSLEEREQLEAEVSRWRAEANHFSALVTHIEACVLRGVPLKNRRGQAHPRTTRLEKGIAALNKVACTALVLNLVTELPRPGCVDYKMLPVGSDAAALKALLDLAREASQDCSRFAVDAKNTLQLHWRNQAAE